MPASTDIIGLAGIAIAVAATLLVVPGVRRFSRPRLALLIAAVVILILTPFRTLPAAAYLRGITGDLSVTTLIFLGGAIFRRLAGRPAADDANQFALAIFVSVAALALYPLALGLGPFDPYRLGYGSRWFLGALAVAALAAWFVRLRLIAVCIALAVLAWTIHWCESGNVWDYLLDPFVSLYALGSLARRGAIRIFRPSRRFRSVTGSWQG